MKATLEGAASGWKARTLEQLLDIAEETQYYVPHISTMLGIQQQ